MQRWLIGRNSDAGSVWGEEEKGAAEDAMDREHHRLNGMNLSKRWEIEKDREDWCAAVHIWTANRGLQTDRHDLATENYHNKNKKYI